MKADWVIVTGGNRGLGYDICRKLVKAGRPVILCSRDVGAGRDAASRLERELGTQDCCVAAKLDASDAASVQTFITEVGQEYDQRIHALINNAGVYPYGWTREIFDGTLGVNLMTPVALATGLAPHMAEGGRIVNVTSGLGALSNLSSTYRRRVEQASSLQELQQMPFDGKDDFGFKPSYCLSKAMINRATQLMTQHETFKHLSVNSADPGWCRTDMGGSSAPRSEGQGSDSILAVLNKPPEVRGGVFTDGKRWRQ